MSLIGRRFVRREPAGDDPGNIVVLKGVLSEAQAGGGQRDLLIVSAAEFGAVPAAWEEADALFTTDELAEEYRPETAAEAALAALSAAAKAATDAATTAEGRISPWAYFYVPKPAQAKRGASK